MSELSAHVTIHDFGRRVPAMIVPLRYLLGMTTVPVRVPDSRGVGASESLVDISVSLFEAEFENCEAESERRTSVIYDQGHIPCHINGP